MSVYISLIFPVRDPVIPLRLQILTTQMCMPCTTQTQVSICGSFMQDATSPCAIYVSLHGWNIHMYINPPGRNSNRVVLVLTFLVPQIVIQPSSATHPPSLPDYIIGSILLDTLLLWRKVGSRRPNQVSEQFGVECNEITRQRAA